MYLREESFALDHRIALLQWIAAESSFRRDIICESMELQNAVSSNMKLITIDLNDPSLTKEGKSSVVLNLSTIDMAKIGEGEN